MTPLRVLLIGNFSDRCCGFANFSAQMITALNRQPTIRLETFDGTYSQVYARQQDPNDCYLGMFPANVASFDVVHIIWHAMTMNHYSGAPWGVLHRAGVLTSWWDGGPSDAYCPFEAEMQCKWGDYPQPDRHYLGYPVPDWVDNLPEPNPHFTVGVSSVRGDGVAEVRQCCEALGCAINEPQSGQWLSVEDEIRRLARSTVNVCWYNTPAIWKNRASAPSMLIASRRPLLINEDMLVEHLADYKGHHGVYHGRRGEPGPNMLRSLELLKLCHATGGPLHVPWQPFVDLGWHRAAAEFESTWRRERQIMQQVTRG